MRCDLVDTYTTFISTHICFTKEKYQIVEFVLFLANMTQHQQTSIIPEMRFSATFGPHFDEKRACLLLQGEMNISQIQCKIGHFSPLQTPYQKSNWIILADILMKERATECRWNHGFHSEEHISQPIEIFHHLQKWTRVSRVHFEWKVTSLCDSYLKIACGKFLYVRHICIVVLNKRHPCAISGFAFKYEKKDVCRTR